jgi:hypothetical protein
VASMIDAASDDASGSSIFSGLTEEVNRSRRVVS